MSRSMRSRSFSRCKRAISAAWSADGSVACVVGRRDAAVGSRLAPHCSIRTVRCLGADARTGLRQLPTRGPAGGYGTAAIGISNPNANRSQARAIIGFCLSDRPASPGRAALRRTDWAGVDRGHGAPRLPAGGGRRIWSREAPAQLGRW